MNAVEIGVGSEGGYLSDVPAGSEDGRDSVVQEVNSTLETVKVLEKNYSDRLNVVKDQYEKRLRHMGDAIKSTCMELMNDEMLAVMKGDTVSQAYIPAHLDEVIGAHFQNEREQYINNLVIKCGSLELELTKMNDMTNDLKDRLKETTEDAERGRRTEVVVSSLKESVRHLQEQCQTLQAESKEEMDNYAKSNEALDRRNEEYNNKVMELEESLNESTRECEVLRTELEGKIREIELMAQSADEVAREMGMLEDAGIREREVSSQLREQLTITTTQRDAMNREIEQLKARFRYASEELEKTKTNIEAREFDEGNNRQRMATLMQQVEAMLSQEAAESNAAVNALHQKLEQLKYKYTMDLQREKRLATSAQDELTALRGVREETIRELRVATEDCTRLREQLKAEQARNDVSCRERKEALESEQVARKKLVDAEQRAINAEERLREAMHIKAEEIRLAEERARLNTERKIDLERTKLGESIGIGMRSQYRSGLEDISNQLRHSYSFGESRYSMGSNMTGGKYTDFGDGMGNLDPSEGPFTMEEKLKMQDKLREAAGHIEKLKHMVKEAKLKATQSTAETDARAAEEMKRLKRKLTEERERAIRDREADAFLIQDLKGKLERGGHAHHHSGYHHDGHHHSSSSDDKHKHHHSSNSISGDKKVKELEDELERHRDMLVEVREQALKDHAHDANIISDMKKKFDRLMQMHNTSSNGGSTNVNTAVLAELREAQIEIERLRREWIELNSSVSILQETHVSEISKAHNMLENLKLKGLSTAGSSNDEDSGDLLQMKMNKLELEARIRNLEEELEEQRATAAAQLQSSQADNEVSVERVRNEADAEMRKVVEDHRSALEDAEELLTTEQRRRQELQEKLIQQEEAHRQEVQTLNANNAALQRRTEQAELAFAQLKMGH